MQLKLFLDCHKSNFLKKKTKSPIYLDTDIENEYKKNEEFENETSIDKSEDSSLKNSAGSYKRSNKPNQTNTPANPGNIQKTTKTKGSKPQGKLDIIIAILNDSVYRKQYKSKSFNSKRWYFIKFDNV